MSETKYRYELLARVTRSYDGTSSVREFKWDEEGQDCVESMIRELVRLILVTDDEEQLTRSEILLSSILIGDIDDGSEGMEHFARIALHAYWLWKHIKNKEDETVDSYFKIHLVKPVCPFPGKDAAERLKYAFDCFQSIGGVVTNQSAT